jgi:rhodanese-related sulfurtransferase
MVSPQELVFALERGTVTIVDVRPEKDYEKVGNSAQSCQQC